MPLKAPALPLLFGSVVDLETALLEDQNMIHVLSGLDGELEFYLKLYAARSTSLLDVISPFVPPSQLTDPLPQIVSRHLDIPQSALTASGVPEWIQGSSSVIVPVFVDRRARGVRKNAPASVIVRFAVPYRCGDVYFPGEVDEKVRCGAATYAWLQRECPSVRTPFLHGFGFPGGQSVLDFPNHSFTDRFPR